MAVQLCILVILGMVGFVVTQPKINFAIRHTPCPKIAPIANFNTSLYAGVWYQVEKYNFPLTDNTECVKNTFFDRGDGGFNLVYTRDIVWPEWDNKKTRVRLRPRTADGTFEAYVKVEDVWVPFGTYTVLNEDYDDISIIYSCQDLILNRAYESLWIMSRNQAALTAGKDADVKATLDMYEIYPNLEATDQTGCTY